jgi:hypothetical protein
MELKNLLMENCDKLNADQLVPLRCFIHGETKRNNLILSFFVTQKQRHQRP